MIRKRIIVAIVTYNSRAHIGACLSALAGLSQEDQIVMVDNGSTDGTVEFVRSSFPNITVIENRKNYFLSYALNQIIRSHAARAYLVLNPDVVIQPDTIEKLYQSLRASRQVGIVAPALVSHDGSVQSNARRFPTLLSLFSRFFRLHLGGSMTEAEREYLLDSVQSKEALMVDWVIGACMLIRADVCNRVGAYRPIRYPLYYNDADLCWRASEAGFLIQYVPMVQAVHEYQQHSVYGGMFTVAKALHIIGAILFLCRRII